MTRHRIDPDLHELDDDGVELGPGGDVHEVDRDPPPDGCATLADWLARITVPSGLRPSPGQRWLLVEHGTPDAWGLPSELTRSVEVSLDGVEPDRWLSPALWRSRLGPVAFRLSIHRAYHAEGDLLTGERLGAWGRYDTCLAAGAAPAPEHVDVLIDGVRVRALRVPTADLGRPAYSISARDVAVAKARRSA